ncbi:MAG: hypothetical protein ACYTEN_08380 [Planctomycetota bacterium]
MQKNILLDKLDRCRRQLDHALALDAQHCGGQYVSDYLQDNYVPAIETCRTLLQQGRFDLCGAHVANLDIPRMPPFKKKQWPEEIKDTIKDPIDKTKGILKGLADCCARPIASRSPRRRPRRHRPC